jgi:Rps23 Pro-64 3,4-dihydroxylase Tpa1-like proline 4-hydroxylase
MLSPLDRDALRASYRNAKPFPFFSIDHFLEEGSARKIAEAYPPFEVALDQGKIFSTINERKKVQITDASKFTPEVKNLDHLLASPAFLADLSYITGIPNLLADDQLSGGGIHITGPGGKLDVHVDFNFIEDRKLHRRLNLLLYLNPDWKDDWGGQFQLWDRQVKHCAATFSPILNRCVVFETSDISYHGVVPISPAAGSPRKSFAAYYYTREAPAHWRGQSHSTIFVARPEERFNKYLGMPAVKARETLRAGIKKIRHAIKAIVG